MQVQVLEPRSPSLESAARELRDAVELREAEHARRNRNRVLFNRAVILYLLGITFGLVLLRNVFDPLVFESRLYLQLESGAPAFLRQVRNSMASLTPAYREEANRTLPAFSREAAAAIASESNALVAATRPVASGDLAQISSEADKAFALELLTRFGAALDHDPRKAMTLARALRNDQVRGGPLAASRHLGESFVALDEIGRTLRSMGPDDPEAFQGPDAADAVATDALDLVRTRLLSGHLRSWAAPAIGQKGAP